MLESLRERLLSVQQDLSSGLKIFSDKSREAKINKQRTAQSLPEFSAGLVLLSRYEDSWAALHKGAKECAKTGELVDSEVVMLSAYWEKKRSGLLDLEDQLQQIPGFLAGLESTTTSLVQLEAHFKEMEHHLLHLEDLCGQCELQRYKHMQILQCENYKKTKRKELEIFKAELDTEHVQKVLDMEHNQEVKLKERQKFFEEAFQQDMEQYLTTGYLQIAERREPIGSMSSMEVNVDTLEQMDLVDMSDQEALDVFLNSGVEDNSLLSAMIGSDSSTHQNEISFQVPTQSELEEKFSSEAPGTESTSQDACEGEAPVVQSDEEDVQVDTALVNTETKSPSDVSDESD
ncbi:dysbindin isoform X1 [Ahaetulla prasina]|uniref:dysbindin isoform X1 n=2 Tax=Ahaetulla prasina TaxID=499056 RepID=UPI0026496988|nr:dysbindin isoform X1 [Ahaetulla prasina]